MTKALMFAAVVASSLAWQPASAAPSARHITSPMEQWGHAIGEDYFLANYDQLEAYWKKLATETDRMKLQVIGQSAEGRNQYIAIVSSPANLAKLGEYKAINRRLAKPYGLTDDQAHALAKQGKAVVWIDGGLHATEVEGAAGLMQMLYTVLSRNDEETRRILDDTIILFSQVNPDGMQLVSNWYMRNPDPTKREMDSIPRLYQKYVGHDNNRDFFAANMPEAKNINRILYRDWFPQVVYNHHQTGPAGEVVFIPPFRDPFNYNLDPLSVEWLTSIGSAMQQRLAVEDKPGAGSRSSATYSNWTNGTLRSSALFHNSLGIITEIIGSPTPFELPLIPHNQLARNDIPFPVPPQTWHFKQTIDYSISMDYGALDYASREKDNLLYAYYKMNKNGIDKGTKDTWVITPKVIAATMDAVRKSPDYKPEAPRAGMGVPGRGSSADSVPVDPRLYDTVMHDPARRIPRGYVLSPDQRDFPTAVLFADALIRNGVEVKRATAPFSAGGRTYPAGALVVMTGQPYRAQVLDMFEPQNHPDDLAYPGGPPIPPYDMAGYTLAYSMGVKADRVLDAFSGPFEDLKDEIKPPAGAIKGAGGAGFLIAHEPNNAVIIQNRLLKAHAPVYWVKSAVSAGGGTFGPGAIWVPAGGPARAILEQAVRDTGVDAYALDAAPAGDTIALKPVKVGVVQLYGGIIPAGWTRWLMEQYEYPYDMVYPQRLDAGDLKRDYDVLVFADGVIREGGANVSNRRGQPKPDEIPAEFRPWLGQISADRTYPQIETYLRAGGTVVTIGTSTRLAYDLKLPVENALVETTPDGKTRPLPPTKLFIPGALMTGSVDTNDPLSYGLPNTLDLFVDQSPAFKITGGSVKRIAWYPGPDTLHSGWAFGQKYLDNTTAIAETQVGAGKFFMFGPEVAFRGNANGTFKFLFNSLFYGPPLPARRAGNRGGGRRRPRPLPTGSNAHGGIVRRRRHIAIR